MSYALLAVDMPKVVAIFRSQRRDAICSQLSSSQIFLRQMAPPHKIRRCSSRFAVEVIRSSLQRCRQMATGRGQGESQVRGGGEVREISINHHRSIFQQTTGLIGFNCLGVFSSKDTRCIAGEDLHFSQTILPLNLLGTPRTRLLRPLTSRRTSIDHDRCNDGCDRSNSLNPSSCRGVLDERGHVPIRSEDDAKRGAEKHPNIESRNHDQRCESKHLDKAATAWGA